MPRRRHPKKAFDFTLVVDGADLQTDAAQDALYEAGCDDALFGVAAGTHYADFGREAASLADAIADAIAAVEAAVPGAVVRRVEPDEMVTLGEIADRVGRTYESVRLLAAGERGPGGFPAPVNWRHARDRLWRWPEVTAWFAVALDAPVAEPDALGQWRHIAAVNAALELRRRLPELPAEERRSVSALATG